jgi:cell fate regulator YaaT (PSP1 superfamily)
MIIVCQIVPWDKPIQVSFEDEPGTDFNVDLKVGDKIIIKGEQGTDLATVIQAKSSNSESCASCAAATAVADPAAKAKTIFLRKAHQSDVDKLAKKNEQRSTVLKDCEELVKKHNLPMKLIDVLFHLDGGRITFAFTAASKVDFRQLVRELAQKLHRSIRLYQVGARQEVEMTGDIGPCGRALCCLRFLSKLGNVTTDLIFDQQIAHRGVDRLSGICGRLKCCLLFEEDNYKELAKDFPPQGSRVKTPHGNGKIIAWQILKQTGRVALDDGTILEVPIKEVQQI